MKPGSLFTLLFIAGGILGVLIVRGFFLNPLQEIGWRLFWTQLAEGNMMDVDLVFKSATFAKCLAGFIIGGFIVISLRRISQRNL